METTTTPMAHFLRLLWQHLCSVTTDPEARLCLARSIAARPVTGGMTGWKLA